MTGCDSHDGNINTLPVSLSYSAGSNESEFSCIYFHLKSTFQMCVCVCFQVLFSMVQACNDIIISENTDSAPIPLLFGVFQGCKLETGVS